MGILDAPTVVRSGVGSAVAHELANNQRSINMCVISDSTGVDTVEQTTGTDRRWVYLLAQLIGQDFPAYTVQHRQWNATNLNYDAATTIQTGTGTGNAGGPFVFTVYGATKSGATVAYWLTQLLTSTNPVLSVATFELILLCDGHNETGHGADVRPTMWQLQRAVQYLAPGVQIGWVTQNPQYAAASATTTTLTEQNNQLLRQEEVRKLARSEGVGLIEVQPVFLADATYGPDYINTDGVHPNSAGSALWASAAHQHFPKARDVTGAFTGGPIPKADRILIPAKLFDNASGAPVYGATQQVPCWQLPNGSDSIISCIADWPAAWQTINVYVLWNTAGAGSGSNWRCAVGNMKIAGTFLPASSSGSTLTTGNIALGSTTTIAGANANVIQYSIKFTGTNTVTGLTARPQYFQIKRVGTDGLDTLAQAVNVIGLMIERAS